MNIEELASTLIDRRSEMPAEHAMLAGISGIDASGKGYVASKLRSTLENHGLRVAQVNVDGWLNLPSVRFDRRDPAGNFYRNALRLCELFERLILPLRAYRRISIDADLVEETASEFRRCAYHFENIDVILLEGIFIFKREFVSRFDLKIWVDCTFDTALRRAVLRSQEGLPEGETVDAYLRVYFPAQQLHFAIDRPRESVDIIFENN